MIGLIASTSISVIVPYFDTLTRKACLASMIGSIMAIAIYQPNMNSFRLSQETIANQLVYDSFSVY
jgi:hypothetical protein